MGTAADRRLVSLGAREAAALLQKHSISPRKGLGQNFVVDPNTIERIVRLAGVAAGDHVVEIGPGLGSLTAAIADAGARVVAVEVDDALLPALRDYLGDRSVTIVHQDAMAMRWAQGLDPAPAWKLVANLPYNVGTPLVLDILPAVAQVQSMTVMVQREVAERLAAGPDTADYGIPSVVVRYWASAQIRGYVPPTVFLPKPRVESAIITITRKPTVIADASTRDEFEAMMDLVRRAFRQRRKMIRSSLGGIVDAETFTRASIDSTVRPAELDVEQWSELARRQTEAGTH